ncbi:MAG TPA: EAL domain-containing protein [Gallionella sp.]|nr:EAL domain-containing protein [Gallionella sp.]
MPNKPNPEQLIAENMDLRARLEKAEATLGEILSGEADALFITGAGGAQLFTLKGADQSYRTLIENMSEGALTLTREGLVLYANRRFAGMLGTPLEKVIGSEVHNWIAPESRQALQALLRNDAIENHNEELALVAADGTRVPVYLSVSRLVLEETPDTLCMVVTDLTEQKRNEAILTAEKLARAILEQAADAIVICDKNGRIMRTSKQAQAFCSRSPHGQLFEHAFPLHQQDGNGFPAVGSIDTNRSLPVEASMECNGKTFNLLVSVGHLKGARDELLGSVVTLTDITERKIAELALQKNEKQLSEALIIARIGYWEYEFSTDEFIFNDQYYSLHKITAEDAGGYRMSSADFASRYVYPEDIPAVGQHIRLAFETGDSDYFAMTETRILSGEGEIIWVEVRFRIVKDLQGNTIRLIGVNQDITERKQSEARIIFLNRVYAVLSGINSLIVRVQDRDELFREACQIVVENGGFRMSMVVIVNPGTKKVVSITSEGKDEELSTLIKDRLLSSDDVSNTMVGLAINGKQPVVSNDSLNDPRLVFGKKYAESGVRSMVVLPLIVADEAVGTIALYASEIEFFHEEEMLLLTELAGDIAFAIDHIGKQEKLNYLAYYDVLTGLANRSLFFDRAAQYIYSAISGGHKLAIGLIDLERFKNINDSLGRPAGDSLLKQMAEWLTQFTRDTNLLARIDADHFAFVVPEVKTDGNLAKLVEKLMATFLVHPFRLNETTFRIGIKVGIAVFPDDAADIDTLFNNAEAALKKAKASGDRYLFYTQKMSVAVADKLALENQLREAIDNEEFVLYYQPKVNLVSGKVTSAEALIRWNNPRTGLVPPGMFIPILEETGLIYEVGRWALRRAIEDYQRWRAAGLPAVRIAVNVSPLQLRNPGFVAEIRNKIAIDAHAADGLELEITESLIMADVQYSIDTLKVIRAMGITIAIDDFGTGFSSLNYLAKLPVDTLKIDRSFVIEMDTPEGMALVSTITMVAHALKLKVVAEGVETEKQSRQLLSLNCDEMQGFLFSKPVPAEIFEARFLAQLPGE